MATREEVPGHGPGGRLDDVLPRRAPSISCIVPGRPDPDVGTGLYAPAVSTTRVTRHIRAPRPAVYRALLEPDAVQQWMVPEGMTSSISSFDGREGGTIRISLTYDEPTTAGKTDPRTDVFSGRFVRLVQDTEVVQALEFETDDPALQGEMTITYTLADAGTGTDLVGIHENLPAGVPPDQNELGWNMSMDKLAKLVEPDR